MLATDYDIVFPMHPRTTKRIQEYGLKSLLEKLVIVDPVDYITMIAYTQEASLMITDSGGIQVETSVLGIPCLTVRGATEQVHTLKEGTNKLITPDTICDEAYEVLNGNWEAPSIYNRDSGKASENIITILEEMYNE
jgi:UDP-N-acetylglucosamine 2-epimerase